VHTPRPQSNEAGFGLIELLIAMVVLNVGLLAIVAAFSAGAVATARAGNLATASTLADQQMEQYRALTYDGIGLDTTAGVDAIYNADKPKDSNNVAMANIAPTSPNSCAGGGNVTTNFPTACQPSRVVNTASTPASPDRHTYRVDTYVNLIAATANQRATKLVTVIVRDGSKLSGRALARQATTFDCSTGQVPGAVAC